MKRNGVHISTMSGKLEGLEAINVNPMNNQFCEEMSKKPGSVCSRCYSRKMLTTFRSNCVDSFEHNSIWLSELHSMDALPDLSPGFFRFLSHGELSNATQAKNMLNIARKNPLVDFALWTKRPDLVAEAIRYVGKPDNIKIIQSSIHVDKADAKHPVADMVFTVYSSESWIPEGTKLCSGQKCARCGHCYKRGLDTDVSELLR